MKMRKRMKELNSHTNIVKRRNMVENIFLGELVGSDLLLKLGLTKDSALERVLETLKYAITGKNEELFTTDDAFFYLIMTSEDGQTATVMYIVDLETMSSGKARIPDEALEYYRLPASHKY